MLHDAARRHPAREAIVDARHRYSYAELLERVRQMAKLLHTLGVRKGDRIALLMLPSTSHLIALFGAIELGAIPASLHVRESEAVLGAVLEHLSPRVLVYEYALSERAASLRKRAPLITGGICAVSEATRPDRLSAGEDPLVPRDLEHFELDFDPMPIAPDDTAVIALSSGTTGIPKGVMHTHRTQMASARSGADILELNPDSSIINLFSTAFIGWYNCTLPFLNAAAKIVFMSQWDPAQFLDRIVTERISICFLVPTMWRMLLRHGVDQHDLSSVRKAGYAGEPMDTGTMARIREQVCPDIINTYGTTETGCWAGCTVMYPEDYTDASKMASVGRPAADVEIRIIKPGGSTKDILPPGEQGELLIRGPSVARQIWDQPEITRRVFRGPWWHSGDMGSIDADGYVYLHGRLDDMIISGGINVLPTQVEDAILTHPAVSECVVIGLPDAEWGQRITAFVIRKDEVSEAELTAHVEASDLSSYKRPREYRFVADLPRGNTGKVNRRKLREELIA